MCLAGILQDTGQFVDGIGFVQERKAVTGIVGQHMTISTRQDDGEVGPALANLSGQFHAIHPRHDDVGEKNIDLAMLTLQDSDRFLRIGGALGCEAQIAQQLGCKLPDLIIILYDKDAGL